MKRLLLCMTPLWSLLLQGVVEKPIVVIIPSYNNEKYVEKNLNSVYDQKYDNYRVVYVDDCSKDKTLAMVQEIVARRGQAYRTIIIHNDHNCGALFNLYTSIHACLDDEIVITLDGDDWFAHERVFAVLNETYADGFTWLTHGRYKSYPSGKVDDQEAIPQWVIAHNAYREDRWRTTHLRTFYAGLFKQIALSDLIYDDRFFSVTWDMAFMFPMLEMAAKHTRFLDEIVYIYNCENPLNDYKQKLLYQIHCEKVVRARKKYAPLKDFHRSKPVVALCLLAHNTEKLERVMCSCEDYIKGAYEKIIFYRVTTSDNQVLQTNIQSRHQQWKWYEISADYKQELERLLSVITADYLLIVDASAVCSKDISLQEDALFLQLTNAQGLYYCLRNSCKEVAFIGEQSPLISLGDNYASWFLNRGSFEWRHGWNTSLTLFSKKNFLEALSCLFYKNETELIRALNELSYPMDAMGIMHLEAQGERYSV